MHACPRKTDGQTDGQTDEHHRTGATICSMNASRAKNKVAFYTTTTKYSVALVTTATGSDILESAQVRMMSFFSWFYTYVR